MQQIFTSNGSWTCPDHVSSVRVECWGAGADGENNAGINAGGGGAYARVDAFACTPFTSYAVVVGQHGYSSGGDSTFNINTCVAKGGGPLTAGGSATNSVGDVKFIGGNGSQGAINIAAGAGGGGAGNVTAGTNASGATGGAGGLAGGGKGGNGGASAGSAGSAGDSIGGGGGNGFPSATSANGGYGANGQVTLTWEFNTVKVLVVAGGGHGGGTGGNTSGGGGGGGAVVYNAAYTVADGDSITVTVGAGSPRSSTNGQVGDSSIFGTITAVGGACGGTGTAGGDGACGGGAAGSASTLRGIGHGSVGYDGGNNIVDADRPAGGGGGMGAVGATATGTAAGNGGAGIANTGISATLYAGGGGGGQTGTATLGTGTNGGGDGKLNAIGGDAASNTGSGGGGGSSNSTTTYNGGAGGSGIVLVRYTTALFGNCTGGTKSVVGDDTIHTFTGSGAFLVAYATQSMVMISG